MSRVMVALLFLFSFGVYAQTCTHDIDCETWAPDHCACGVHAACKGATEKKPEGTCRCFGAEGTCYPSSKSSVRIRGANPKIRTAPIRRNAVP